MSYKDYFKGKKIAVIGFGPHGEMLADIKFLLKSKSLISLYDMRSEERVRKYTLALPIAGIDKFSFAKINDDDLLSADLIILASDISKKSNFLKKAVSAGIEIEYADTLFFKLTPPITLIGVIGSCGKSTVSHLIYSMLKKGFAEYDHQGLFFIDPDSVSGALNNLRKIKKGDVVLARIPEHLSEHYHKLRISPHVVVITSLTSFSLLAFQTYNNFIVAPDKVIDAIKKDSVNSSKAKILRTRAGSVSTTWNIGIKGVHNLENAALALQTIELFKVPQDIGREVLEDFEGLRGHIEFVKKVSGIEFYNDTASITAISTLAALRLLSHDKNIILILGGAYTGHDYDELIQNISRYVSTIILLPGSGSLGLRNKIEELSDINFVQVLHLEDAVEKAKECAKKGDKVLFSPGFEAVGVDVSRKERGERFVRAVRGL